MLFIYIYTSIYHIITSISFSHVRLSREDPLSIRMLNGMKLGSISHAIYPFNPAKSLDAIKPHHYTNFSGLLKPPSIWVYIICLSIHIIHIYIYAYMYIVSIIVLLYPHKIVGVCMFSSFCWSPMESRQHRYARHEVLPAFRPRRALTLWIFRPTVKCCASSWGVVTGALKKERSSGYG